MAISGNRFNLLGINPRKDGGERMRIEPKFTGRFSVGGVGRVGSYESAVRSKRCRARKYWAIFEDLPKPVERIEGNWRAIIIREERTDAGKFKSKTQADEFLRQQLTPQG